MKQIGFVRPTDYYDESLSVIDEQICMLFKERKVLSNKHPGFPPDEYITKWAEKFKLYEDLLRSIFGALRMEDEFRPRVEPTNFIMHIPILKSIEIDKKIYTVTFIRQFENASVVHLDINWDGTNDSREELHNHHIFEMNLGKQYDCRPYGGRGGTGQYTHQFIVTPPIPDDPTGLIISFIEYNSIFSDKKTRVEVKIHVK